MAADTKINLEFNTVILIKSLEPTEADTTLMLQEVIKTNLSFSESPLAIIEYKVKHANEFLDVISQITKLAKQGLKPLINVDCHGDKDYGLEFENGSNLSWEDLAGSLTVLNEACDFNLIAIFSACFGAHYLRTLGAINPASFAFILAPTDEIYPDELLRGLRAFYNKLFDSLDLIEAFKLINSQTLQHGGWFAEFAALWYVNVVTGYVEHHCTKKECRARVAGLHNKLKANDLGNNEKLSMGELKRGLLMANRTKLTDEYFDRYFMIDRIPANKIRFASVKQTIEQRLAELRAKAIYLI